MTSRTLRHVAAFIGFLLALTFAWAAPVNFDIPRQPAASAIKAFIKQSNAQVAYRSEELDGVTANEVKGSFEPEVALDALLKDTGCSIAKRDSGIFVVTKAKPVVTAGSVKGSLTGEGGKGLANVLVSIRETSQSAETDRYGQYAFPNVAAGTYVLVASATGYQTLHITDVNVQAGRELILGKEEMRKAGEGPLALEPFVVHAETIEQLEKIEVTASKPQPFSDRNVDLPRTINDVQPYYIFDSQKIEESGTTTVEEFLKQRLTLNTTVRTNSQTTLYQMSNQSAYGNFVSTASSINLQGLGTDHTLILVNGLPMAGVTLPNNGNSGIATPGQADVNGIPLGAIDRIEVLPSSAGAIYGAGAEGGVINIILKKAYSGGEISATYASTWDGHGPSRTIQATIGKSLEHGKTQLFVTALYSDQSPMYVQDRAGLLQRGFNTLAANDPAFVGILANTSTTYNPPIGSTPNFASAVATYPVPINTPGVTAANKTKPNGFVTTSGLATTASLPWVLTEVLPLTLKSTGTPLGGANPYIATLPAGYSSNSSPASIIGGQWNLGPNPSNEGPNGLLVPLGNYPRHKSIMATLTREMTSKLQLHFDYAYDENHAFSNYNPLSTQNGSAVVVPASAPINPFNQSVRVAFPLNYTAPATSNTIANAVTIGGTLKLPFDWIAHLDYQWSQSSFKGQDVGYISQTSYGNRNPTFGIVGGVDDPNPTPYYSGAFNPFLDTLAYPINLSPFARAYYDSSQTAANHLIFAASGPLYHLPWGDPRLTVRLEHDKTSQVAGAVYSDSPAAPNPYLGLPDAFSFTQIGYGQSQSSDIANAELDLPIFKTKLPLLRSLDVQFNISTQRTSAGVGTPGYEIDGPYPYQSGGPTTSPTVTLFGPNSLGAFATSDPTAKPVRYQAVYSSRTITGPALSYQPTEDIIFRASVAGGYIPPTYAQLLPANARQLPNTVTITDPTKGGASYTVTSYSLGGNPDLNPTTAKSWDFGAIWEPKTGFLRGLRLDAEFTETKQYNLITNPGAQGFINFEKFFPNQVVRDPASGLITTVYDEYINVAEAKQDSWTFSLDYRWQTAIGSFEVSAAETIQEHNQQQLAIGTNFLEYVGFPNSGGVAKTKTVGTLRWARGNWVAAWTVVNFGGYNQYGASGDPGAYATQLQTGTPYDLITTYTVAQGGNTIPSQTYHNLYLSYSFPKDPLDRGSRWGRWTDALLSGMKVGLVVNNVFNTIPPFDAYYQPFYTSPYGDIQLRNYAITLRKSF